MEPNQTPKTGDGVARRSLQDVVRRLWRRVYSTEEVLEIDEHGKVSNPKLARRIFGKPIRDPNGTY